ncbi:uncharacterized protein DFL_005444 [Arthrobotrys flagrans]|uniref:START domain-containing protein n=1 Tax=Arthrobotrys flagrans TaxID=97331 RepID=A0A436ZXF5_ARTFL|nr:hypothetical protein DFL_005444 [Arthrobotrys flagrans]
MSDLQPPPDTVFDQYAEIKHPDAFPDALKLLKHFFTDKSIPWTSNGTKNDVELSTYQPDPPLPAPVCRGIGTFPKELTAEQILPVIHQLACRKYWDERYKLGFPSLRYSRKLVRFYAVQKGVGEGWFAIVAPRDFTGYSGHVKEVGEDGVTRYYYLQTSAEFDDVPEVNGIVRGQTSLAGWVLEEGAEGIKCTYIVKFDPKGSIPGYLLEQVVKETPLCIARVRSFIEMKGLVPYVNMHDEFPGQLRKEILNNTAGDDANFSDAQFQFVFSWFGVPGSFDVHFDDKRGNGVKVVVEEGAEGEDLELVKEKGKVTVIVKEGAKDKKLQISVSRA